MPVGASYAAQRWVFSFELQKTSKEIVVEPGVFANLHRPPIDVVTKAILINDFARTQNQLLVWHFCQLDDSIFYKWKWRNKCEK